MERHLPTWSLATIAVCQPMHLKLQHGKCIHQKWHCQCGRPSLGKNVAWKPNGYKYYNTSTTPTKMQEGSRHASASNAALNYTNVSGGYWAAYNLYQQQQQDSTPNPSTTTTQQIQTRQTNRPTQSRLLAISAKQTIAEIGSIIFKMTNIVSMQGEHISRIQDVVKASMGLVDAGAEMISKVYGLQKGTWGLILKTFGLLNALLYLKKKAPNLKGHDIQIISTRLALTTTLLSTFHQHYLKRNKSVEDLPVTCISSSVPPNTIHRNAKRSTHLFLKHTWCNELKYIPLFESRCIALQL